MSFRFLTLLTGVVMFMISLISIHFLIDPSDSILLVATCATMFSMILFISGLMIITTLL